MSTPRLPQNYLLSHLPDADYRRLSASMERVDMTLSDIVYEAGVDLKYAYFPVDCIVSLLCVMKDGDSAEVAIVGNEGVVGISQLMGAASTISRAIVQCKGAALRMPLETLNDEFKRGGAMQTLLLRYTQALMAQITQTAACNLHHSVEQQFGRWLLLSLDRLPGTQMTMTKGLIANMLGVRRAGTTDAIGKLTDASLIRYQDGCISVLDRPGLERLSCECYAVVRKEFDRLLPGYPMH